MNACSVEVGLLRKHPCGKAAVAACLNCDQPLCVEHAVPQMTEGGSKTGKFMCKECTATAKDYAKRMVGVAQTQDARKKAAFEKSVREQIANPPAPPKKPPAAAPQAPAEPAAAEKPKESEALEFTPSKKSDEPGQ